MAGMDSLSQGMPNPVGGAGGGMGGKSPGPSPAAKQGMQEAMQQALRERAQPGSQGPAKGGGGAQPGKGEGAALPGQAPSPGGGGAFGMSSPGEAQTSAKKEDEDYDPKEEKQVFLRMMVAQLEHQDPLNPTEGTEFTAQLAQFNNVEQQIRSNDYLEKMTSQDDQQQRWNAMSLLGRDVVLDRDSLKLDSQPGKQPFQFQVDAPAHVAAQVTDSEGNVVKEMDLGKREGGSHKATWDGTNNKGEPVPAGEYTIRALPARGDGSPYQTQVQATVQEVKMGDKGVQLGIGQGQTVAFDRIKTVSK